MSIASQLHSALEDAGLPVMSVSIGKVSDRSTWKASLEGATTEQRARAVSVIANFDMQAAKDADAAQSVLSITDAKMTRIVEDIYDALISKGVLKPSDLPNEAVTIIESRKTERGKL